MTNLPFPSQSAPQLTLKNDKSDLNPAVKDQIREAILQGVSAALASLGIPTLVQEVNVAKPLPEVEFYEQEKIEVVSLSDPNREKLLKELYGQCHVREKLVRGKTKYVSHIPPRKGNGLRIRHLHDDAPSAIAEIRKARVNVYSLGIEADELAPSERRQYLLMKQKQQKFIQDKMKGSDLSIERSVEIGLDISLRLHRLNLQYTEEIADKVETFVSAEIITVEQAAILAKESYEKKCPKNAPEVTGNCNAAVMASFISGVLRDFGAKTFLPFVTRTEEDWLSVWSSSISRLKKESCKKVFQVIVRMFREVREKTGYACFPPVHLLVETRASSKPTAIYPQLLWDLIECCKALYPGWLLYILLQVWCGLRPEEALKITYDDLDLINNILILPKVKSKNKKATRYIRLRPAMRAFVANFMKIYPNAIPHAKNGNRTNYTSAKVIMKELFKACGYDRNIPKEYLRKAFVSSLEVLDYIPREIQLEIGHEDNSTWRRYDAKWKELSNGVQLARALWIYDIDGNLLPDTPDSWRPLTEREKVTYEKTKHKQTQSKSPRKTRV